MRAFKEPEFNEKTSNKLKGIPIALEKELISVIPNSAFLEGLGYKWNNIGGEQFSSEKKYITDAKEGVSIALCISDFKNLFVNMRKA